VAIIEGIVHNQLEMTIELSKLKKDYDKLAKPREYHDQQAADTEKEREYPEAGKKE